jgi:signal peptidase I
MIVLFLPKLDQTDTPTQSDFMTDTAQTPLPEATLDAKPQKAKEEGLFPFLLKLVVFVFVLRSFIFAPFNIPSESMLPRLLVGDYLLVSKWSYGYSRHSLPFSLPLIPGRIFASQPERGDVAVFKAPPTNDVDYIKRVIGLPGDFVQVKGGQVILNGVPVPKKRISDFLVPVSPNTGCEPPIIAETASDGSRRCRYPRYLETLPGGRSYAVLDIDTVMMDDTQIYTVPEGHLFMMGDNRDRSADSRYPAEAGAGIGLVPQENLVGKAWFSVFSTDGSAVWYLPWTWFTAARWDRIGEGF